MCIYIYIYAHTHDIYTRACMIGGRAEADRSTCMRVCTYMHTCASVPAGMRAREALSRPIDPRTLACMCTHIHTCTCTHTSFYTSFIHNPPPTCTQKHTQYPPAPHAHGEHSIRYLQTTRPPWSRYAQTPDRAARHT